MEIVLTEGIRGGVVLIVAAVVLGIAGLSPSLTWIPEAPVLAAFALVPLGVVAVTGYRTGMRIKRTSAGALAAALAGAAGGFAGGLTYMAFGKPAINVLVGVLAGALQGAIVGGGMAWYAIRRMPNRR
jgi:hypothetical protein